MTDQSTSNLVNFTIDGKPVTVPKGTTVYEAAKNLQIEIPIFCYQDRMPPFGACRMCLVEVEKMGKPQTSCTLIATEGMVVKTQSEMAEESRKQIIELLLINHPLDCPVCDRGGECPLQDNTMKYGPGLSQFYEKKRNFDKDFALGPVLMLDRERCISCARCTRFCDIVAGDHALEFIDRGYKTEVGTRDGMPAESKFIGNTIYICPVGALTSRVYRFRARPWDNTTTESTCTLCPVGCSLYFDARDGEVMRTRSRENRSLNDIWLCDKGWFGYEFSDHKDRLRKPLIRGKDGHLHEANWDEAFDLIVSRFKQSSPAKKIGGLGGNPLTTEENFLFQQLIRQGSHTNHVDHRVSAPLLSLDEEGVSPGMEIEIGECAKLDFAVVFGCDLTEEFPIIWLRLKEAINQGAKVLYFGHFKTEVAKFYSLNVIHSPGKELETLLIHETKIKSLLQEGKKGAFFIGSQYLYLKNKLDILLQLQKWRETSLGLSINLPEGRGNSMGARFAGMRPDLGPCGERLDQPGLNALEIVEEAAARGWDYLHVAGANVAAVFPADLWNRAREKINFLVVQDLFLTETASQADVVLPTLCYPEKLGRFINIEGRVLTLQPGKAVPEELLSDGAIFSEIGKRLGLQMGIPCEFRERLEQDFISREKRVPTKQSKESQESLKEGLKGVFVRSLFDHGVRMKHDNHLIELSKQGCFMMHSAEGKKQGLETGDLVQLQTNEGTVNGSVCLDDKVAAGTILLPLGYPELPVRNLSKALLNGFLINMTKLKRDC